MMILQTILALIVTLGILVSIHEYGHFWVARRCGVKVLRFSIGFGRPLYRWYDRHGTEFVIAALPLGGYVKMLDEREGEVAESELPYAFNRQPVQQRIAIAAAGPLANFIFAVLAYWAMFIYGTQTVVPVIGATAPESPAEQAAIPVNAEIVAVDGVETHSWQDVSIQLLRRLGDSGAISLQLADSPGSSGQQTYDIPVSQWLAGEVEPDPLTALGIKPYRPPVPAVIDELVPDGQAQASGIEIGDRILQVNGQGVSGWYEFVERVKASPGESLSVLLSREGREVTIELTPAARTAEDGAVYGFIGAGVLPPEYPQEYVRTIQFGPLESIQKAAIKTWDMIGMILDSIKKILVGLIAVENLGGPITIAKVASASASSGVESFLHFLAYLSISLGVLNLLPIPVLDGGHLLYYFVELVRGKPLSEQNQLLGLKIGMAIIAFVMLFAFYNDLSRM